MGHHFVDTNEFRIDAFLVTTLPHHEDLSNLELSLANNGFLNRCYELWKRIIAMLNWGWLSVVNSGQSWSQTLV